MRGDESFFDTNVLVYALDEGHPRGEIAGVLLAGGGVVGVQNLNEFAAVARRKFAMTWTEILEALRAIRALCPSPVPLTAETHDAALRISREYGYHIYDSLVIAAALQASCATLYTEDLRDGQVIEGLTIRNPFPN